MTPDFSQLIAKLTDSGFEFVMIGGYAAVTHGASQVTRDLDICAVLTGRMLSCNGGRWPSGIPAIA